MPSKKSNKGKQRETTPQREATPPRRAQRANRNPLGLGNSPGHPIVLGSSPIAPPTTSTSSSSAGPSSTAGPSIASTSTSIRWPPVPTANTGVWPPGSDGYVVSMANAAPPNFSAGASSSTGVPTSSVPTTRAAWTAARVAWESIGEDEDAEAASSAGWGSISSGWGSSSVWREDGLPINHQERSPSPVPARVTLSSGSDRVLRSQVSRRPRTPSPPSRNVRTRRSSNFRNYVPLDPWVPLPAPTIDSPESTTTPVPIVSPLPPAVSDEQLPTLQEIRQRAAEAAERRRAEALADAARHLEEGLIAENYILQFET